MCIRDRPAYGTTQVMYYNKAAFEKAGIDPATIKTWQDLAAAAEKMTASDGSFVGWEPMWGSGNLIDAALSLSLIHILVGNHSKSAKAEGSLTATPTGGAGTKVGLSDPV